MFEQATNYAPDVTEYTRVEHLVTAVLTKTKCNPQCYHDFIKVLELDSIRPDTEAACSLLPKGITMGDMEFIQPEVEVIMLTCGLLYEDL